MIIAKNEMQVRFEGELGFMTGSSYPPPSELTRIGVVECGHRAMALPYRSSLSWSGHWMVKKY